MRDSGSSRRLRGAAVAVVAVLTTTITTAFVATSVSAQAAASPYTCTVVHPILPPGSTAVIEISTSATAPATALPDETVTVSDLAIDVQFDPADTIGTHRSGVPGTVGLSPGGTIELGDPVIGDDGFAIGPDSLAEFRGASASILVEGEPGTTLDVAISSFAMSVPFIIGGPLRFTCTPSGPPAVVASIQVVDPTPICLESEATIVGGPAQTTVVGTPGDDVIVARAPGATILPGNGADKVCAEAGDGTVSYADTSGPVLVALNSDVVVSGGGVDHLAGIVNGVGSPRPDGLVGDDGPNTLRGGKGTDLLIGLGGADVLDGGEGADVIFGDSSDSCISAVLPLGCSRSRVQ